MNNIACELEYSVEAEVSSSFAWNCGAKKTFKIVSSHEPGDLVFQSLVKRGPMSDHNILSRHIKPAAQRRAVAQMMVMVDERLAKTDAAKSAAIN